MKCQMNISIDTDLKAKFEGDCTLEGRDKSKLIKRLIELFLDGKIKLK